MAVNIRWMIRRDMPSVLGIEERCYRDPWSEHDFLCALRQRNCIGMVAEEDDAVVGFMLYEMHKHRIHVLSFAVDPGFQREGIGTAMLKKLKGKLSTDRRNRIVFEVADYNLDCHLFLKACGFRAENILHDHWYENTDAYVFIYRYLTDEERMIEGVLEDEICEGR